MNNLSSNVNLISTDLIKALDSGDRKDLVPKSLNEIYVIKIKQFSKESKVIIYSYMPYNIEFCRAFIRYLSIRNKSRNILKNELGSFIGLIDNEIFMRESQAWELIFNDSETLAYIDNLLVDTSLKDLYSYLFKLNYCTSLEKILELIEFSFDKKNIEIINRIFSHNELYKSYLKVKCEDKNEDGDLNKFVEENLFSFIDNSIILTHNLERFNGAFKKLGFNINQGPQSSRGLVSNLDNFLSNMDIDFRNSLYRHHIEFNKYTEKLARSKFSYKNIHMNLGSVRYYNTYKPIGNIRYYSSSSNLFSRQNLFLSNYNFIRDSLENVCNNNLEETQLLIEEGLYDKEFMFNSSNSAISGFKFSAENYIYLNNILQNIEHLISKDVFSKNRKGRKSNFVEWVPIMVKQLGANYISNLLLSYLLEIVTKESVKVDGVNTPGVPSITAYEKFGSTLVNRYIYDIYRKSNYYTSKSLNHFKYDNNDSIFADFKDDTFNAKIGGPFMGVLMELDLLYESLDIRVGCIKEKEYYLRIDNKVRLQLLAETRIMHIPQKLPMICKPKDYVYSRDVSKNVLGGYLLNNVKYTDEIFKSKRGYEDMTVLKEDNVVISLINGLSQTEYKVNCDTLDFIKAYGIEKGIIKDDSVDYIQEYRKNPYGSFNKTRRAELRSLESTIIMERNIINIADCYSKLNSIYFPVRLDQRTRIYCESDYFNYQSSELAKGLISFSKPGMLTKVDFEGINYFKAYGANMFGEGLDKKSTNYKIKWIDDNKDYILNFRYNDIINRAENKACFVSFCFEYEKFTEFMDDNDTTTYYTYLPIQLDASCNGYQHLALLTKETKLFDKLNLVESTFEDSPDDFYKYILDKTNSYIEEQITVLSKIQEKTDKQIKTLESLKVLKQVGFDRSIVKKAIMTKSYNAGVLKQSDDIMNNLTKFEENITSRKIMRYYKYKDCDVKITKEDILVFVVCIKSVIDNESPRIKELSEYLNSIIKICTKLNIGVPWTLPSGAIISERYQLQNELAVKAFSFVKARYTFKRYIKGEINYRKQLRATMPNLIHSLDASTIALLYKDFEKVGNLYTVHDCFATTADNVVELINNLKYVYINIYSSIDYLCEFDKLVRLTISKMFGSKVFDTNGKYVYVEKGVGTHKIAFPDVNKLLKYDNKSKYKIEDLKKSSYTAI